MSDQMIYNHLSGLDAYGRDVVGLYPILPDDTCFFLAIDFDDGAWQENVSAVRNICAEWEIPCAVEQSRSGEGAHLWIFFSAPLPCSTARKLGSMLLTAAADNRIFTQEDYWPVFSQDIRDSQKEIQIVTPYLHIAQVKRFLSLIPDGVKTTIITGNEESFKPDTWVKIQLAIDLLRQNQVQVISSPKVYQRYAVIDRQLVWYGGINYLGFEKAAQGAMRLNSTELAKELLIHPSAKS